MPSIRLDAVVHYARCLAAAQGIGALSDQQLLERFIQCRDEAAFEVLVWRHGSLVFGACRRILGQRQDAEDAFQATFMALARKAGSIAKRSSIGGWLFQVACRLSFRIQRQRRRRQSCERDGSELLGLAPYRSGTPDVEERETSRLLMEELQRLPERYRTSIISCYLEGKPHREIARELNSPVGSISSVLARGCALLRARLQRRGATLSVVVLTSLLTDNTRAALPQPLVLSALTAALKFSQGLAVPGQAAALAQGVLRNMTLSKLFVAAGLVVLCLGVGGMAGLVRRLPAEPAWQASTVDQIATSLEQTKNAPGEVDVFGDPLPKGAVARLGTVRLRHSGPIQAVTFSPDGRFLASTHSHGEARIWETATGKKVGALVNPLGSIIKCIAYSPDGRLLATDKGGPSIWDAATGAKLHDLEVSHSGNPASMEFAPNGQLLALCASHDQAIWLYDPITGKAVRSITGHTGSVKAAVFSKDGKTLASGSEDRTARLWDLDGNKVVRTFAHDHEVVDVALSADGKLMASKTAQEVHLWDIASGRLLHKLAWRSADVRSLAFSPDGKMLASEGILWDVRTGKKVHQCENSSGYSTAFSPDGRIVAVGGFDGVRCRHW
jgi:RNA polymerase sigma factor (sigma-70 family)